MNSVWRSIPVFSAWLVLIVGIILFAGGVWLVVSGGSPYRLLAGVASIVTGTGLIKGRH
ncbi:MULTISPECIES: hypothetical protein [unclassified Pseudomonas]|uniref:hypothetical protein n=1 Tax=unclassified Pseudomonas TaxID=196821 RepID=UPI0038517ED0